MHTEMCWREVFFPIRNPDGDELPLEPQTVYVMFSVDKIEGKLFDTNDISMIQYNAGGLIPHLDRTNTIPFSERVQAFTIQPNPRRAGDGTVEDGAGWWWRWDFILSYLYDKEGYLTHVQFPINQGSWNSRSDIFPLQSIAVLIKSIWVRNNTCNCLSITIGKLWILRN